MRLFLVLLVVCVVSVDATFRLGDFFKKFSSKETTLTSVVETIGQAVSKLSPIKKLLQLNPKQAEVPEASSCGKYECPRFYEEELNVTGNYKLRCYPKSYQWVTTQVNGPSKRDAFMRLLRYIRGNNDAGMKMNMTVPVTTQMKLGSHSMSYQAMSFFIQFEHQSKAPKPYDSSVRLEVIAPFCAYVQRYGGFSSLLRVAENYQALVAKLKEDGRDDDITSDGIYYVGYDSHLKLFNRRNEIMLVSKKHKPSKENTSILEPPSQPTPVKSYIDEPHKIKKSPKFCGDNDCPYFYEKLITTEFTLRCYPKPYKWVSTSVANMRPRGAGRTAFRRLFNYIQGSNAKQMKIDMTVPVTMKMQPSRSSTFVKNNFTMSFFIPFKHQKDAPSPSDDNVTLTNVNPFCAYVKVYDGFSNIKLVEENYKKLVEALKRHKHGDDFYTDMFYTAGYDSPFKLFNRHNEIWLISKSRNPVNDLLQSGILTQ